MSITCQWKKLGWQDVEFEEIASYTCDQPATTTLYKLDGTSDTEHLCAKHAATKRKPER